MSFITGHVPHNTKFDAEKEKYLLENYKTTSNKIFAEKFGVTPSYIGEKLTKMGVKRTKEEISALLAASSRNRDCSKAATKRLKIEGGGRNGKSSIRWHKDKWIKLNGEIPKGMTLVYEKADYENFNDLILIKNRSYTSFIKKRNIALRKEERIRSKAATNYQSEERRRRHEKEEKLQEDLKKNYKQKTLTEVLTEQIESEKVPVRLDHKTLIFVKKEKCYQDEGGNWHKKQS